MLGAVYPYGSASLHASKEKVSTLSQENKSFDRITEFPPLPQEKQIAPEVTALIKQLGEEIVKRRHLNDKMLQYVLEQCPNLRKLNLAAMPLLTNQSIKSIAEHALRIKSLNLAGTQLRGEDLKPLIKCGYGLLEELNLALTQVSSSSVKALLQVNSQLKKVSLPDNISSDVLLEPAFPALQEITLIVSHSLTIEDVMLFIEKAPQLKILRLNIYTPLNIDQLNKLAHMISPKLNELYLIGDRQAVLAELKDQWCQLLTHLEEQGVTIRGPLVDFIRG